MSDTPKLTCATLRRSRRSLTVAERRLLIEADAARRAAARGLSSSREHDQLTWFALFVNPLCERRVELRAIESGLCAYVAEGALWSKPRRATEPVMRPRCALPRYVFIAAPDGRHPDWFMVRRFDGVHSVVGVGGAPLPMRDGAISKLRDMQGRGELDFNRDPRRIYQKGDALRVVQGPFAGMAGPAVAPSYRGAVDIELMLFGRVTVTSVPLAFIAEAA